MKYTIETHHGFACPIEIVIVSIAHAIEKITKYFTQVIVVRSLKEI